jgi:hypothetical protein
VCPTTYKNTGTATSPNCVACPYNASVNLVGSGTWTTASCLCPTTYKNTGTATAPNCVACPTGKKGSGIGVNATCI